MAVEYEVDLNSAGREFPHYWELCVGSCHAATLLREDVRRQIRKAHEECGFRYLRFHGLFDDDMSVVLPPVGLGGEIRGEEDISFYNVDSIFDFLLEIGMKPFVELGFMPEYYAAGSLTCFHYRGNVSMPAEDGKWIRLIREFGEHLLDRYGREEVGQWYFEVWNEPNLRFFFDGTQEDYFHLYEMTARTLKETDPCFRVGGPATSGNAWILEFRRFCEDNKVPLDFITTHHYPTDDPLANLGVNGPGYKGDSPTDPDSIEKRRKMSPEELKQMIDSIMNRVNRNPRDVLARTARKASKEAEPYPLYYTEWNGSMEFDTSYQAAFVIQTIAGNEGLVKGYSFWTVSDIFEEQGLHCPPFNNEFGMLTKHGIEKPVYQVFKALHQAGNLRLDVTGSHRTAEVLALANGEEREKVTLFVYNHDLERRNIHPEEMKIALKGKVMSIKKAIIDDLHCNPRRVWEEMGSPRYLTAEGIRQIAAGESPVWEELPGQEENPILCFEAAEESVTIFEIVLA